MRQVYCPACGHKLHNADERGVALFIKVEDNTEHYCCNRIECMNFMLELNYKFFGIAKSPKSNTCEGDCA